MWHFILSVLIWYLWPPFLIDQWLHVNARSHLTGLQTLIHILTFGHLDGLTVLVKKVYHLKLNVYELIAMEQLIIVVPN